jgi:hypothetical protein
MAESPFEYSLRQVSMTNIDFHAALVSVNDTVDFAKKILLNNKIQQFTAAEVVKLTEIVMLQEQELYRRRMVQYAIERAESEADDGF